MTPKKLSKEDQDKEVKAYIERKKADEQANKVSKKEIEQKVSPPNGEPVKRNLKTDKAMNDAMVDKKPKKDPPDPNLVSVSDIANELGVEPKAARSKLRRARGKAVEGRWPKVKKGSKEHAELVAIIMSSKDEDLKAQAKDMKKSEKVED